jgi:uncharacterized protein (DUF779 family)
MSPTEPPLVHATTAAEEALARLAHVHGPVVLMMPPSHRWPGTPMCLPARDLTIRSTDVLLGRIGGCPVYAVRPESPEWVHREVLVDVEPGDPDGLSLAAGEGRHFVIWVHPGTVPDHAVMTLRIPRTVASRTRPASVERI